MNWKTNENLKRCPRCGKPRTIFQQYSGFVNIRPGQDHTISYMRCDNPNCSRKKISYLVSENPQPMKVDKQCKDEFDQLLDEYAEHIHV